MQRSMLKGKIHGATVTDARVDYEGSITVDASLMQAADVAPYEHVRVWSLTTGERIETYAIPGEPGSGKICVNGAAAHRIKKDESVIITTFAWLDEKEGKHHSPRIVFVDKLNSIRYPSSQPPSRSKLASR